MFWCGTIALDIYYMKDEHGNECPYDFKNIQFKRNISLENGYPELDNENGEETWVYTFCGNSYHIDNDEWSELQDGSLESPYGHMNDESSTTFVHNTIKPYTMVVDYENEDRRVCGKQHLNNIVFLGWWERLNSTTDEFAYYYAYCCCFNTFGYNCRNNTLGCHTNYNTFGNGCFENYIGSSSWCNFGHYYNWENFSNGTGESFSYGHKLSSVYEHRLKIDTKNSRVTIDNVVYGFHFYTTLYKKDEFARDIVNYFPNSCKMNVSGYVTINPTGSKDIAMPIFEVQRYNDFFHISFIQEGKYNSITVYVSNLELTVETNAIT